MAEKHHPPPPTASIKRKSQPPAPFQTPLDHSLLTRYIIKRSSLPPLYPSSTSHFKQAYFKHSSLLIALSPPPPKQRKTSSSKEYRKLFKEIKPEYTPLEENLEEGSGQSWVKPEKEGAKPFEFCLFKSTEVANGWEISPTMSRLLRFPQISPPSHAGKGSEMDGRGTGP